MGFKVNGNDAGDLIALSGILLKQKKEISFRKFPIEIKYSLNKYGKNKIRNPEIIKSGEEIYYQAQVKRFWLDEKLVLD